VSVARRSGRQVREVIKQLEDLNVELMYLHETA
jgi:hypothetical protein